MTKFTMQTLTPNLMVKEVADSINFYHNILGFEIIMKVPEVNPIWAFLKKEDVTIMLQQKESLIKEYPHLSKRTLGGSFSLFIKMNNLDEFFKKISFKVKVIKTPHITPYNMNEFAIEDLDGYLLVFAEEK